MSSLLLSSFAFAASWPIEPSQDKLRCCYTRRHVPATCPRDTSPRQIRVHVTRCDLTLQRYAAATKSSTCHTMRLAFALQSAILHSQRRPWLADLQISRSDMSHEHVTRGDRMCVQHSVPATCRMNSNWFEFVRHVAGTCRSNMLHKKIHVTRGVLSRGHGRRDMSRGHVASCDRTLNAWPCSRGRGRGVLPYMSYIGMYAVGELKTSRSGNTAK